MLSGVPNFALTLGYTNASWTLKCDLVATYVCRLLQHLDRHGYAAVTPVAPTGQTSCAADRPGVGVRAAEHRRCCPSRDRPRRGGCSRTTSGTSCCYGAAGLTDRGHALRPAPRPAPVPAPGWTRDHERSSSRRHRGRHRCGQRHRRGAGPRPGRPRQPSGAARPRRRAAATACRRDPCSTVHRRRSTPWSWTSPTRPRPRRPAGVWRPTRGSRCWSTTPGWRWAAASTS